jgi:hypothetical protein
MSTDAEKFEVLTKFTTDDITVSDALLLRYREASEGDPNGDPVYLGAALVKGGAAIRDEPERLYALAPF